jgi:hypothetical protein
VGEKIRLSTAKRFPSDSTFGTKWKYCTRTGEIRSIPPVDSGAIQWRMGSLPERVVGDSADQASRRIGTMVNSEVFPR